MTAHVAIVGASLAGLQCAQTLRRQAPDLAITLIGDEPHLPYDRPPLSKGYLAGTFEEEKLRLRAAADPDALGITWRLASRATALDVEARAVTVTPADGDAADAEPETIKADAVVIATGARPRTIPGAELDGVHVLRSLDDARALRSAFEAGPKRVVVIGAGFIGAEVAATARERGIEVTMIEAAPAPLARVLDEPAGMAIADLHRSHGVDVRLGVGVSALTPSPTDSSSVAQVELSDGSTLEADVVVVGIGVIPNTDWLESSSLSIDNGVVCDAACRAAPDIYAAGDVASWPNLRFGGPAHRVEQWDNAIEQAGFVAKRLLADAGHLDANGAALEATDAFTPIPWFWSDQYDRKIQLAGITGPRTELVHGSIDEGRFVQLYLDTDADGNDEFVGALAWNRPRQAIQARQLLTSRAPLDEVRGVLGG